MAIGWIKLHRQIQECEFLWDSEDEPFDRRSAWIDLLLLVNHEDKRTHFNGQGITIKCGQRLTSLRILAERWHWSKDRVKRYLDSLESEGMIIRESDNRKTLLTIVNYEVYQSVRDTDETPIMTQTRHRRDIDETQTSPKQEIKNDKNDKKFIAPTLDEVKAYIKERNSSVDAQKFFDYYEAGGWKDSKGQSVKNWKQKLITWEKKDTSPAKRKQDFPDAPTDLEELQKRIFAN